MAPLSPGARNRAPAPTLLARHICAVSQRTDRDPQRRDPRPAPIAGGPGLSGAQHPSSYRSRLRSHRPTALSAFAFTARPKSMPSTMPCAKRCSQTAGLAGKRDKGLVTCALRRCRRSAPAALTFDDVVHNCQGQLALLHRGKVDQTGAGGIIALSAETPWWIEAANTKTGPLIGPVNRRQAIVRHVTGYSILRKLRSIVTGPVSWATSSRYLPHQMCEKPGSLTFAPRPIASFPQVEIDILDVARDDGHRTPPARSHDLQGTVSVQRQLLSRADPE